MKFCAVLCVLLAGSVYAGKIIQAEDLPTGLVPQFKIDELKARLENGSIPMSPEAVTEILGTLRKKREQVSEAWCCKMHRPDASLKKPITLVRYIKTAIPAGGSIKCGFSGWKRCSSDAKVTTLLTEYYTDYSWVSVPSEEWNNGCPEEKIVCCAGYIERKVSNNCLTNLEYSQLIDTQMKYCHYDLRILDFWVPQPLEIECPVITKAD